jgi:zinc transport system substrate-binding protein
MTLRPRKLLFLALLVVIFIGAGCGAGDTPASSDALTVTVSIAPQRYFVERIGGEHVNVNVMVEPGASPHSYEPKPAQMRALSESAAYFSIGVDFEDVWLDKIAAANTSMRMVDTVADIERMPMAAAHEHEEGEMHEEEDDHVEGRPDPHVWTSPSMVEQQAQVIYNTLIELDPEHEAAYTANLEAFRDDIWALEEEIHETLNGVTHRKFMVFHPSWGYFARDFELEQIPIEIGGQEPSAQELARLIEHAKEENIRVIFAQPEFSTQDAETIAEEIDGEVLLISPLDPDWLDNMRRVAETFAEALAR